MKPLGNPLSVGGEARRPPAARHSPTRRLAAHSGLGVSRLSCVLAWRAVPYGRCRDYHSGSDVLPCDHEDHLAVRFEIEEPQAPDVLGADAAQLSCNCLLLARRDLPSLVPPAGSDQHERGHAITLFPPTGLGRHPG